MMDYINVFYVVCATFAEYYVILFIKKKTMLELFYENKHFISDPIRYTWFADVMSICGYLLIFFNAVDTKFEKFIQLLFI